jgi:hypothetical protein
MKIRLTGFSRKVKTHTLTDHDIALMSKGKTDDNLLDVLVSFSSQKLELNGHYSIDCYFERRDAIQLVKKLYGKRGLDAFIADYTKLGSKKRPT